MLVQSEIDRITGACLDAYSAIEDRRIREIVQGLIRHLHGYVKEIKPTDEEWEFAWNFMANMAKFTGEARNEYLLLFDVLGVSQLIEAVDHQRPAGYALVGPFLRANAPIRKRGESIASDDTAGDRVHITGKVYDIDTGAPIRATLDVWQAATTACMRTRTKSSRITTCEADSRPITRERSN